MSPLSPDATCRVVPKRSHACALQNSGFLLLNPEPRTVNPEHISLQFGPWCQSSTVTLDPTSMMLDPIVGKRESREDCEVWNSQLLSPKFWLLPFARFKPVLKGFKPIYTIQGTLFLSHAERQGLSSEAPGPAEAPAKGAWRFRVSAARVFDAGARRTTAGAAVLPKTKMGHGSRGLSPHQRGSLISSKFCNSVKSENYQTNPI